MLKAVFRPVELVALKEKIIIDSPTSFPDLAHLAPVEETVEASKDVEEYNGPTADDLRRDAETFKAHWEEEKERMVNSAKAEAENIINDAQKAAFQEIKRKTDEAQVIKQQAESEAENIIKEAGIKAGEIENEIRQSLDAERKDARDKGKEEGRQKGYAEGKAEVERLIERTQVMLERAQDKRGEILAETEQEIVDLVLLISRKVIKVISESQRDVIISNVIQALRKVKARGNVTIRVNMKDLKLATEHKQDFINLLEGAKSVQVVEDSSVDSGGCIIETDFGEIDARISSQLAELENKILEISPIKTNLNLGETKQTNSAADIASSVNLLNALDKTNSAASPAANFAASPNAPGKTNSAPSPAANFASSPNAPDKTNSDSSSDEDLSPAANAALTASAALAALATMSVKGRRETDKKMVIT